MSNWEHTFKSKYLEMIYFWFSFICRSCSNETYIIIIIIISYSRRPQLDEAILIIIEWGGYTLLYNNIIMLWYD